jgi:hypothetical protein
MLEALFITNGKLFAMLHIRHLITSEHCVMPLTHALRFDFESRGKPLRGCRKRIGSCCEGALAMGVADNMHNYLYINRSMASTMAKGMTRETFVTTKLNTIVLPVVRAQD